MIFDLINQLLYIYISNFMTVVIIKKLRAKISVKRNLPRVFNYLN